MDDSPNVNRVLGILVILSCVGAFFASTFGFGNVQTELFLALLTAALALLGVSAGIQRLWNPANLLSSDSSSSGTNSNSTTEGSGSGTTSSSDTGPPRRPRPFEHDRDHRPYYDEYYYPYTGPHDREPRGRRDEDRDRTRRDREKER